MRTAKVLALGNESLSYAVVLTREFRELEIKANENVSVKVEDKCIKIRKIIGGD